MSPRFQFETGIEPAWIDYNGHMRDSYFGLIFSLAVDAVQDEVGFDQAYRSATGCSIYLVEDHKVFLKEVKVGARVRVETRVLGVDAKRFHLYMQMFDGTEPAAVGEFMEVHVRQHPGPRVIPMPTEIRARLEAARVDPQVAAGLPHRARSLAIAGKPVSASDLRGAE